MNTTSACQIATDPQALARSSLVLELFPFASPLSKQVTQSYSIVLSSSSHYAGKHCFFSEIIATTFSRLRYSFASLLQAELEELPPYSLSLKRVTRQKLLEKLLEMLLDVRREK